MGFTSSSKFPLTPRHLSPLCMADFPAIRATGLDMLFQPHARVPCCVTPSLRRTAPVQEFQPVLHRLCVFASASAPPYPETTLVAQDPSGFRWAGFSPAFSILIPAFSLLTSPRLLPVPLLRDKNAPLPRLQAICHSFGSVLEPRTSSAQRLSTSELLRTL